MAAPFMKGKGAFLTIFIDGQKMPPLEIKSWTLKKVVEEIADGVNGEDEDRLDTELKHYELTMECFNSTAEKLKVMVKYDQAKKSSEQPQVVSGIQLRDSAGGSASFSLSSIQIGGWSWASSGRTDRSMLSIPMRGNNFNTLA